jgi:hypothetical protein
MDIYTPALSPTPNLVPLSLSLFLFLSFSTATPAAAAAAVAAVYRVYGDFKPSRAYHLSRRVVDAFLLQLCLNLRDLESCKYVSYLAHVLGHVEC